MDGCAAWCCSPSAARRSPPAASPSAEALEAAGIESPLELLELRFEKDGGLGAALRPRRPKPARAEASGHNHAADDVARPEDGPPEPASR